MIQTDLIIKVFMLFMDNLYAPGYSRLVERCTFFVYSLSNPYYHKLPKPINFNNLIVKPVICKGWDSCGMGPFIHKAF